MASGCAPPAVHDLDKDGSKSFLGVFEDLRRYQASVQKRVVCYPCTAAVNFYFVF
jgi:hypothetical protein